MHNKFHYDCTDLANAMGLTYNVPGEICMHMQVHMITRNVVIEMFLLPKLAVHVIKSCIYIY